MGPAGEHRAHPTRALAALAALVLLVFPASAGASVLPLAGTLDPTLAYSGIATLPWGSWAGSVGSVVEPGGAIVSVGEGNDGTRNVLIANRVTRSGLLDPHFAHGGIFTFTIAGDDAGGNAIALLPHGKLLLVGSAKVNHAFQFVAVRLLPNGVLDRSFGQGGYATVPIGSSSIANAVAIQRDGRIVLAGTAQLEHNVFAAARLNRNGTLDRSFGNGGVTTLPPEGGAWWMALQRDGKIVLAGQTKTPPTQDLLGNLLTLLHNGQSFMAARLQSNGQPDPSFGMGGIDTIPIGQTATGFSVAVRGNGRILLAGNAYTTQLVAATAQLLPNGALDPSYGSGGIATLPVAQGINAMTLASQGRILLAGVGASAIRLLPGGAPDPSFGNGGIVTVPIGSDGGAANGVTVAPHNKIVLVGAATLAGKIAQTVIRLNG